VAAKQPHESLIDRRVRKIANARSVTFGLAVTFVILALVCAVVVRVVDKHDFPTFGLALWWSLQTVTTVGYGDVVPTTHIGRLVGGVELVLGVSFIAFLTAGVTSTVIEGARAGAEQLDRERQAEETRTIVDALTQTRTAIADLDRRLDTIESKLTR
jgi:voltage-gated potassium channel